MLFNVFYLLYYFFILTFLSVTFSMKVIQNGNLIISHTTIISVSFSRISHGFKSKRARKCVSLPVCRTHSVLVANNGRALSAPAPIAAERGVEKGELRLRAPAYESVHVSRGAIEGGRPSTPRRRLLESNRSRLILMVKSRPTAPGESAHYHSAPMRGASPNNRRW